MLMNSFGMVSVCSKAGINSCCPSFTVLLCYARNISKKNTSLVVIHVMILAYFPSGYVIGGGTCENILGCQLNTCSRLPPLPASIIIPLVVVGLTF